MLPDSAVGAAAKDRPAHACGIQELPVYGKGYVGVLQATGTARHFARDRVIYYNGEDADRVFKVEAGVVRTYKLLRDGRRQVDLFHRQGEVFGLEIGARYSLSAAAASDCTVILYHRSVLEKLAANSKQLSLQLFSSALSSLSRAQEHSLSLGRRRAAERIAIFLMDYLTHSGESTDVLLEMPRKDIADYLGLTIETVSRTLSYLEHSALIELVGPRRVRLRDTAGLRALCT